MTSPNEIRHDVRLCLVQRINARIIPGDGVGQGVCLYQPPTADAPRNMIFFGDNRGPTEPAVLRSSRVNRDDQWTLEVYVVGTAPSQGGTYAAVGAVERAQALFRIIEDHIADHPKLDGEVTGLQQLAIRNNVDGPNPRYIGNQWSAVYQFEIECRARLV